MARHRKYGEDLAVAQWHRNALEEFYGRLGHRLSMADRDWTEFCKFCHRTLCIWEEIRDRGQALGEKSTSITEKLAKAAHCPAWLVAAKIDRPPEVELEIAQHWDRLMELYEAYQPVSFSVRTLYPLKGSFRSLTPREFAKEILILHRDHHRTCKRAQQSPGLPPVDTARLQTAKNGSTLWMPTQELLGL